MESKGAVNEAYTHDGDDQERITIPNGTTTTEKGATNLSLAEKDVFVVDRGKGEKVDGGMEPPDKAVEEAKDPPEVKPEEENIPPVGFFSLFRYSTCCDRILIIIASIVAIASGASMPAIMIVFGQLIDVYIGYDVSNNRSGMVDENTTTPNITTEEFMKSSAELCMWNAVLGSTFLVCNYIMVSFFSVAAANQAFRIRCRFMQAALKQDMAWYDTHQTGDFASRMTGDLTRIQEGMGEKVGICLSFVSSTLLCVGSGIYIGWKLALVILSVTPILTIAMAVMSKIQADVSKQELDAYGKAGSVAEEVLAAIRTVVAFGGQTKEIQRYEDCLVPATRKAVKRGVMTAIGASLTWFCIFAGYALAFWYGVRLIVEGAGQENPEYTGGKLITIFFNVMSASMFIGQTAPYFEAFALARGAAAKIYSIIDRVPVIDSSSVAGLRPAHLEGHIRINDVHFNYPARPTVPILRGLHLEANPGETVALVGSSGCGKSTIVQLLLRFYDTAAGSVELDGIDVRELNLGWLRDHIGLVGQEPVLFSTSIEENIRMGRDDATLEDIQQAAIIANAHDFIQALPKGYQTNVGDRGTQLSGGQKQRIAIARALIRNPRILLLDEATSALDTESESVVQAALDKARRGRTTLVVAHRLSTIRNADKIVVLDEGMIKEMGTHEELMKAKGLYYQLVVAQTKEDEEKDEEDEDLDEVPDLERRISVLSSGSEDNHSLSHKRPSMDRQVSAFSRQISTLSAKAKEAGEVEEEEVDTSTLPTKRLLKVSSKEWPYALIGGISALIMGIHFPGFGIIFGDIIGVLALPVDVIEEKNAFFCLIFVAMSITSAVFCFLQILMFTIAGEKLTFRLRKMVFANIITQDISFFDNPKNSVGSLCSRLNTDASNVQGATGSRISTVMQALSTAAISIFIGLFYNWKIGLLVLAFVPLVLLASALEARVISGHMHAEKHGMEEAAKVAIEALESIRTVASLNQEKNFYLKYETSLLEPHRKSRIKSHVRGVVYGFAQSVTPFAYAATQYYGSVLISKGEISYSNMLKVVEGVLVGAMTMGQAVAFTPDFEKARVAAVRIFKILDYKPTIDAFSPAGIVKPTVDGTVEFSSVHFNYPNRPEVRVLRGLQAAVQPGQTVALVGSSGCGKSTCIQLLERFYDPHKGSVNLDSEDVRDLNISNHRSHMALVSQEPILFGRSIAENIAYGDNSRKPDMAEIIEAARLANIHAFVTGLPQGYDTPVGDRGTQLSGGQKQRIAIARALIRNPRILLLDEATSALDTESEKVVQDALDQARSGRTCLVIAHRLTTIQNADVILVLHKGRIVERGTHQELINKKGIYYGLHNTQGTTN